MIFLVIITAEIVYFLAEIYRMIVNYVRQRKVCIHLGDNGAS